MRRSEAARYARWSAAVALILAGITTAVYLKRGWTRHIERRQAPPAAPQDVTRQSNGINFKKTDQNRTIFQVHASKSTEFKGQDASLLEEVVVTIFGKAGDRHDVIRTHSCQYDQKSGDITCDGDVRIDVMSAADVELAERNPSLAEARSTRVETRGVIFNRASGMARTAERVTFAFPSGTGEGTGLEYNSDEGTLHLQHDVRIRLTQPVASSVKKTGVSVTVDPKAGQDVRVKGSSLDFSRDSRLLHLVGPAEAESSAERLTAGELTLSLDEDFRAQTLIAATTGKDRPRVVSTKPGEEMNLESDNLTAHFVPEGWLTKLDATGRVTGFRKNAAGEDAMSGDTGSLTFWPRFSQPKELNVNGNVVLRTKEEKSGDTRTMQTAAFRMEFNGGKEHESSKPLTAETLAAGTMEWTDSATQGGTIVPARTQLQADKLAMTFAGATGKAKEVRATGNVRTERWLTGHPVQTATANTGSALMSANGGWSQMDLQGDVKLKEADRSGQGDRAAFDRSAQTATLSGHAIARDATTQTQARRIVFSQNSGDIFADGGVRSTDFSGKSSAVQLAPAPANITAEQLQANSKTGRALYSGKARLWQGDSVLEADSIELLRDSHVLNAAGNVRAVFPQAAGAPGIGPSSQSQSQPQPAKAPSFNPPTRHVNTSQVVPRKSQLWHATSETLTYNDVEGRARLEKNVIVQSADQKMRGPILDLYFTRAPASDAAAQSANNASAAPPATPPAASNSAATNATASTPTGSRQISRAVGSGGVTVEEGDRRATADRGEYTAASGKFVMSGGKPTLYDGSAGTTTGTQLTFFLADDTIIVDSENGSRTLTKHRVQQ
ncbi:MAG TPA: LPS export ABC transporter periplasmic protein LptC [Candidatus Acidoferrum sp.]|nr:LPS export ABC transporter periplasmic protein LptC [Candidatus Acidoferrum sp.]